MSTKRTRYRNRGRRKAARREQRRHEQVERLAALVDGYLWDVMTSPSLLVEFCDEVDRRARELREPKQQGGI